VRFRVEGREYETPASFTLGESRTIYEISGVRMRELQAEAQAGNPNVLAALVLVVLRREDPSVTIDDVDAIDLGGFETVNPEDGPSPPAEDDAALSSATTPESSGAPS
jgi:hypothetical protein